MAQLADLGGSVVMHLGMVHVGVTRLNEPGTAQARRSLYENTDKALLGWGSCISLIGLSALLVENITQGSTDQWHAY